MANYYVRGDGAGSWPYDNPVTNAAPNFKAIVDHGGLIAGDIINYVGDGGTIIEPGSGGTHFAVSLTFQAWSGNTLRPLVYFNRGDSSYMGLINDSGTTYVNGIDFYRSSYDGGGTGYWMFLFNGNGSPPPLGNYSVDIQNCSFRDLRVWDEDTPTALLVLQNQLGSFIFKNNKTAEFKYGFDIEGNSISMVIVNNTFYHCGRNIFVSGNNASYPIKIENNIIKNGTIYGIELENEPSVKTIDYNDIFMSSGSAYSGVASAGPHDIAVDPLFTDPSTFDLSLQSSSPCKNTGVGPSSDADVPVTSYNGVARSGTHTDMGAYEHASEPIVPIITAQPSSVAKNVGETGAFSVTATGMQPLTYEWRKGGVGLTGSTLNEYIIYPVAVADGGSYDVYVTETGGVTGANSDTATLTVKPKITVQPTSLVKNVGESATFSVTAEGSPTPTYQWKKGTEEILGATSSSYTIDPIAASDGGSYTVVVTNSGGSVTSDAATLTVKPNITVQPVSLVKNVGQSATLSVTAEGSPTLTYQWKKGTDEILGATSSSYTIDPAAGSDSGSYTVVVTNSGGSVTSDAATLIVVPGILTQPSSIAVNIGETGAFSVTATGMQPLTYEWRKGGVGLTGSTLNEYIMYPVAATDGGSYDVYVTETGGVTGANSDTATLTVKPNITVQPISLVKNVGESATFSVTAEGYPTPTYQWKKDTEEILGETSSSYTIDPIAASDGGSYTVVVTNSGGSVTSDAATLTVKPNITVQPASLVKSVGQSATFSVTAEGYPTLSYQWKKGVSDILGATSSSYTINPVAASNSGSYTVVVTNSGGSVTSDAVTLAVTPNVTTQPVSQTVAPLEDVTFTVVAEGTATLTYQWQKNHVNISGATTSSLLLENVSESDQANYRVVVTNTGGSTNSNDAYLNVGDVKKDAETDNPDDVVGMPAFHSNSPSMRLRDTQLGTGDLRNTLERNKINHIGNEARDTGFGSSDGARARNHENTNEVKGLLGRMAQLVETITTFIYRIR